MMLKFNLNLFNTKNINYTKHLVRLLSTELNENSPNLSLRQRTWQNSQQRYENYKHVLYSSHLEMQEEHMSYGLKRSLHNKLKKQLNNYKDQKTLNHYETEVPEDWMEDYEYYSGPNEDSNVLKQENNLGTSDPTIPPSKVPCNGCGAILHCTQHTRPGKNIVFQKINNKNIMNLFVIYRIFAYRDF